MPGIRSTPSRRRLMVVGALAVAGVAGAFLTAGSRSLPRVNSIDSPTGAAIKGYDPVAYFVDGTPRMGLPDLSVEYDGAKWLFATPENKARFEQDPARFVPAYGGYCAYGVAQGSLVKIEPDAWAIRDGRLYLNYDRGVQATWSKDPQGYIRAAERNWPGLVGAR